MEQQNQRLVTNGFIWFREMSIILRYPSWIPLWLAISAMNRFKNMNQFQECLLTLLKSTSSNYSQKLSLFFPTPCPKKVLVPMHGTLCPTTLCFLIGLSHLQGGFIHVFLVKTWTFCLKQKTVEWHWFSFQSGLDWVVIPVAFLGVPTITSTSSQTRWANGVLKDLVEGSFHNNHSWAWLKMASGSLASIDLVYSHGQEETICEWRGWKSNKVRDTRQD